MDCIEKSAPSRRRSILVLTLAALVAAGCGGGGGGGGSSAASEAPIADSKVPNANEGGAEHSPGTRPDNSAPTIVAQPITSIVAGNDYTLQPSAADPDGDELAFSVQNKPAWAQFNTATGMLSGRPGAAHVGTYANVVITVSDGHASAALAPFTITVAAAAVPGVTPPVATPTPTPPPVVAPTPQVGSTLQWTPPTQTESGATLSALAGYRIHYGRSAQMLDTTIELMNPGASSFTVEHLAPGTYYFAIRAVTQDGSESPLSNVKSLVIS